MADLLSSYATLLGGEREDHEGGRSKLCVSGSAQVEGCISCFEGYVTESKRVRLVPRHAKLAGAHQKEECYPDQICEGQGLRRVCRAESAGDQVQEFHRNWLSPARGRVLLFVVLELSLEAEVLVAVGVQPRVGPAQPGERLADRP